MSERGIGVSVVIPAWNAEGWLARALDSVLGQTFLPEEVIVVDDGSTDGTADVARAYGGPVRLVSQENRGLSGARNRGIEEARAEWVAFLDADDYWLPGKLAQQCALIEADPELGFISCAARVEYEDGDVAGEWPCAGREEAADMLRTLFRRHAAMAGSGSAVMARRVLLHALGGFDTALDSLEDVDMWMRLAAEARYSCVAEPLVVITRRRGSMSGDRVCMRRAAIRVMRKNRALLGGDAGRYWHWCYAGMLTDYAKWALREGRRAAALRDLAAAFAHAPLGRGRLVLGLLGALVTGARLG